MVIILVAGLSGCVEHVEIEKPEYDGSTVTLKGNAPTWTTLRELDNKKLEFRFYENENKGRDEEIEDMTVKGNIYRTQNNRVYFKAEVNNLNPDQEYHIRALAYYIPLDPLLEADWGHSKMFSFIPNELNDLTISIEPDQQINTITIVKNLLDKNPALREMLLNRYMNELTE
jgi:hypothetical protein